MAKPMIRQQVRFEGVKEAARRLGCSREHLSRVLHGQRKPNKILSRKLAQMGIKEVTR
jgi:transcriptional regulator with XRE-family HTH domain